MKAYIHRTGLIVQLEERDSAGWMVASVPALPGCVSQGQTENEALTNVSEAIDGVLAVMLEDGVIDRLPEHSRWDTTAWKESTAA
jgi:predicted RNase H-like HicB family nuclease